MKRQSYFLYKIEKLSLLIKVRKFIIKKDLGKLNDQRFNEKLYKNKITKQIVRPHQIYYKLYLNELLVIYVKQVKKINESIIISYYIK